MDKEELAQNNLKIIKSRNKSIKGMNTALIKIAGLRQILITMNEEVIKHGRKDLAMENEVIQISNKAIFEAQNKRTKKTLFDTDYSKIRKIIKLLCLAGTIRKVGYRELTVAKRQEMKKDTENPSRKYNLFLEKNIYEILDLREANFSRLKGLTNNTNIHYVSVWEQYTKDLADSCFNRPFGDIQHIDTPVNLTFILKMFMKNKEAVALTELCDKISNFWQPSKSPKWWKENIKELQKHFLAENGFEIVKANKIKSKEQSWKANTLVFRKLVR